MALPDRVSSISSKEGNHTLGSVFVLAPCPTAWAFLTGEEGERVWEVVSPEEDLHRLAAVSRRSGVKEGGVSLTCPLSHLAGKGKSPERP